MIGSTVGNHRILEKLGDGGMGTVYRAVDEMLDREVAIKVLRPELTSQPSLNERFRSEAHRDGARQPPEYRDAPRAGASWQRPLHGHGVCARRNAGACRATHGAHRLAASGGDPNERPRCAGPRARHGRRAPRHQAGEHHAHANRCGEGHGLRHRPHGGTQPPDAIRPRSGYADVHGTGTTAR